MKNKSQNECTVHSKNCHVSYRKYVFVIGLLIGITFTMNAETLVKGKVTDSKSGTALVGVSVVIDGTGKGTITDVNGMYSVTVPGPETVLKFTYIGYDSQKAVVAKRSLVNISMIENGKNLDEVIVVGYGTQKKSVVTASISRVNSDDLSRVAPVRVDDALKGILSGVTVTSTSGQPGAGSQIRIRGIGTVNNSDPLYIVDGMPIDGGIDYLNPNDIKSIEILKDAASGAIYGARAANGVVLVTTKGGKAEKVTVSYEFSYGLQNPWKHRSVLDATQYAIMINEASVAAGKGLKYADPYSLGQGTNWQNEVFNANAPKEQHQISISGGSEKVKYYLSGGYYNQEGIVGGNFNRSNYRRYTLRSNNEYLLLDNKERNFLNKLVVTQNLSFANIKSTGISTNSEYGSPLGSALIMTPLMDVYADTDAEVQAVNDILKTATVKVPVNDSRNGKLLNIPGATFNEITNPIGQLSLPGSSGSSNKFVAGFAAELTVWDNLKLRSSFSNDISFWENNGYNKIYYLGPSTLNARNGVYSSMYRSWVWQLENTLSYEKKFDKHTVGVVLGQSSKKTTGRTLGGYRYNMIAEDPDKANIDFATGSLAGDQTIYGTVWSPETMASYFGRISYNYDERYMFQATIRKDGSSKFGTNNKWATFPSFSLGWNVTNEDFFKSVKPEWLETAKLRASWGKNGSSAFDSFKYVSLTSTNNNYTFGAGEAAQMMIGTKPSGIANPDLRWEESEQTDLGMDLGFFNNKLTFGADYYKKNTHGMLWEMPVPTYVGDSKPWGNVGSMSNEGVEMDASYKLKIGGVNIKVGANATYLTNRMINLGNTTGFYNLDSYSNVGTISRAENGICFPFFYGYKTNGIFQNAQEVASYTNSTGGLIQPKAKPGDVRFVDVNGDGKIDDSDRTKIGKGMPDWTYGFNLNMSYKNFDLSMVFQGTIGNDIYDATRRTDLQYVNLPAYMWNRWTGEGTSNSVPRFTWSDDNGNWLSSDLFVKDGSYLRLKNMQIGYTLPKNLTNKVLVSSLRFYVAAENLLTFTKYEGFDPEIGTSGGKSLGIDRGQYPQSRTFTFGLNLNF